MIVGVADTHTALWYLFADARLSSAAREFIHSAASAHNKVGISSISLAEVVYLIEKKRLPASAYHDVMKALSNPNHVFTEAVVNGAVVNAMRSVLRIEVPEMPDRIIAATARHFDVPVLSRDRRIQASSVHTIW